MMKSELASELSGCEIILTPTRRLASRLSHDFNIHLSQTQAAWETPNIYALNDWLLFKWQEYEIQGKINAQLLTLMDNYDQMTFKGWVEIYNAWLIENHYIDDVQLPNALLEPLLSNESSQTIGLYAFEEINPQFQYFLECLQQNNWQVKTVE